MHIYELWRIINIVLALTSAILWIVLKLIPTWGRVSSYRAVASMALPAYPVIYAIAATAAQLNGALAGWWSGLMLIPIVWTMIAALMGSPDVDYQRRKDG